MRNKVVAFIIRLLAFILSAIFLWFGIVAVDIVAIPLALDYPESYGGQVSFPAMFIGAFSVVMLFRKIVLKKNVRELLIALIFYVCCNAVAVALIIAGQPSLAPPFGWAGILGIGLYFLIIKPFKKGMIEDNT